MTLRTLIETLKNLQESHSMINTFGEGDIYDYVDNGGEIKYPVMWTIVKPSNYSTSSMKYSLAIVFADLLLEDKSNRLTIQSDQILVALDIVSKLKLNNDYPFNVSDGIQIDFFQERFDDFTAGVTIDIEIVDAQPLDACVFPNVI